MGVIKIDDIDFETHLNRESIIQIVKKYMEQEKKIYELDEKKILYDIDSHVTKEPVWLVAGIPEKLKAMWPDAIFFIAVSDREERVVYVMNDHGVIIEKY